MYDNRIMRFKTLLSIETIAKMMEYLSFILQSTTTIILGATAYYLYSLMKMVEESIKELPPEVSYGPPESNVK